MTGDSFSFQDSRATASPAEARVVVKGHMPWYARWETSFNGTSVSVGYGEGTKFWGTCSDSPQKTPNPDIFASN